MKAHLILLGLLAPRSLPNAHPTPTRVCFTAAAAEEKGDVAARAARAPTAGPCPHIASAARATHAPSGEPPLTRRSCCKQAASQQRDFALCQKLQQDIEVARSLHQQMSELQEQLQACVSASPLQVPIGPAPPARHLCGDDRC